MTRDEILDLPVNRQDIGDTVSMRDFFEQLFLKLWEENENFNAKRPWGNSGWDYDVYAALIKAGVLEGGEIDEDGFVSKLDEGKARKYVADEIIWPFFQ